MAGDGPRAGRLRLRYNAATVFTRADLRSAPLQELSNADDFTVLDALGEFYRVRCPDESIGYVYAHNVVGENLPLTFSERVAAEDRAAAAERSPSGWRRFLKRF